MSSRIYMLALALMIFRELTLESIATAYPVLITPEDAPWLVGAKRNELIAITQKEGKWQRVRLQTEEIEEGVAIVFREPTVSFPVRKALHKPRTKDPFEGYFDRFHRALIDDNELGTCDANCDQQVKIEAGRICTGGQFRTYSRVIRIDLQLTKRTAYLVDCMAPQPKLQSLPAELNQQGNSMKSEGFEFHYRTPENVLLDTFKVGKESLALLENTEMNVYLKPKFMFNMHFGSDDVVAEISSYTEGPLSLGVEISTALHVFIFTVNKQICCDINLFSDSLYFPVMLDLPYEGSSFRKGSGLFYGFNLPEGAKMEFFPPDEDPSLQTREASVVILEKENHLLTIGFGSLRSNSGGALAPQKKAPSDLRKIGFPEVNQKHGLFYDATQLSDGFNHFTVWFYVGTQKDREKLLEYARSGIQFTARRIW